MLCIAFTVAFFNAINQLSPLLYYCAIDIVLSCGGFAWEDIVHGTRVRCFDRMRIYVIKQTISRRPLSNRTAGELAKLDAVPSHVRAG